MDPPGSFSICNNYYILYKVECCLSDCMIVCMSEAEPIGLYSFRSYTFWSCDCFNLFSWGVGQPQPHRKKENTHPPKKISFSFKTKIYIEGGRPPTKFSFYFLFNLNTKKLYCWYHPPPPPPFILSIVQSSKISEIPKKISFSAICHTHYPFKKLIIALYLSIIFYT